MGYRRSKERNRRLKKLYDETKNWYGAGAYYDEDKKRYIRYSPCKNSGYTKYLRKVANRKVRRSKDCLKHGHIVRYMIIGGSYSKCIEKIMEKFWLKNQVHLI